MCLQFGIKMLINASCDSITVWATKSQKLTRKKNQMGFDGKQHFKADLFNNSSSNEGLIGRKVFGIGKHTNIVLVSAGIIHYFVTSMALCFGLGMRTMLITHQSFRCCRAAFTQSQGLFSFLCCPARKKGGGAQGARGTQPGQLI